MLFHHSHPSTPQKRSGPAGAPEGWQAEAEQARQARRAGARHRLGRALAQQGAQ